MPPVPLARALVAEAIGTFATHFIVAPLVGASLGGLACQFARGEQPRPAELVADPQASKEDAA